MVGRLVPRDADECAVVASRAKCPLRPDGDLAQYTDPDTPGEVIMHERPDTGELFRNPYILRLLT